MGNGTDTLDLSGFGSSSLNTITMGNGPDTVDLSGGGFNTLTIGSGNDTITMGPGEGTDTFTLDHTNGHLVLGGSGNMVFVNGGQDSITDTPLGGDALTLTIGAAGGNVSISNFSTALGVVDLAPSLGFSNTTQVVAALTSDGHGGTLLQFKGGSVDFIGVPTGSLTTSDFHII